MYSVRNGWKRWESDSETMYAEGADGDDFDLWIGCGDFGCSSESNAFALAASAFTVVSLLCF